jgi:hypothetical protein
MKTIYINENVLNSEEFKKHILMDTLPDDVVDKIINNKTSLGNNPSIPDIFEEPFLLKMAENGFDNAKNKLKEIGEISDVEETKLEPALSKLILKCKEIEKPYRSELEKICMNFVIDLFRVPDETVDISVSLCDDVDMNRNSFIVDPNIETSEFDSVKNAISIRGEVYKRRMLNVLCTGAAMRISENFDNFINEINDINPKLIDLYNKIISLNTYLLYTKNDFGIDDNNKMQLGVVEVSLGNDETKSKIESQGVILPILLMETIKGFMELFISHGLPKDVNDAVAVIGRSDFIKAEPWDMKFGPILWDLFYNSSNDVTYEELPYLIKIVSELSVNKFNFLMKEVFAKTKKGKHIMSKLSFKAKRNSEYDKFVDKMTKMKTDKGIITDDYIHPDEL